jgi:hypothetical protein
MMSYQQFIQEVEQRGLSVKQLRHDALPAQEVIEFMHDCVERGITCDEYDGFILQYEADRN